MYVARNLSFNGFVLNTTSLLATIATTIEPETQFQFDGWSIYPSQRP